ncbi:MAG: C39 family peptidase [Methanobacterium sp.]|nr:C39 family peptidase [Methanobacterium sp.]
MLFITLTLSSIQCTFAVESSSSISFTSTQINTASSTVKSYVETNHELPEYVTINNNQVNMPQFLDLMVTNLKNINSGTKPSVNLETVNEPISTTDNFKAGSLTKSEYITLSQSIGNTIDSTGKAPGSITCSLGTMGFDNLVYNFSKILAFYSTNNRLPNYVSVSTSAIIKEDPVDPVTQTSFTNAQINTAANSLKSYISTNNILPNYVTIANTQISVAQFLQLMVINLINLNSGTKPSVNLQTVSNPSSSTENIKIGNIAKSEYISLALSIKNTINSAGKAPGSISCSLGTISYENLVYSFSKILAYQMTNNRLPNYVTVNPWPSTLGWISLSHYTYHHQTTDYTCGPSSLMMALSYYNFVQVGESWLAKAASSNSNTGTSQSGMITAVNAVNAAYGTNFSLSMEKFTGWNVIANYLAQGIPVIARVHSWIDTYGTHYVLITGINLQTGMIRLGDSSYNGKGTFSVNDVGVAVHEVTLSEFQNRIQWMLDNGKATSPIMPLFNN